MKSIVFEINPLGKPRMVHSDKWVKRDVTGRYWTYKTQLGFLAIKNKYVLGDVLHVVFYLPMPDSWSNKKKEKADGQPHNQKPDLDNLVKAFMDALTDDDKKLYKLRAEKYWAKSGFIEVFI